MEAKAQQVMVSIDLVVGESKTWAEKKDASRKRSLEMEIQSIDHELSLLDAREAEIEKKLLKTGDVKTGDVVAVAEA